MTFFVKRVLPIILVVGSVGGFSWVLFSPKRVSQAPHSVKVWRVNTLPVRMGTYSPNLVLYGSTGVPQLTVLRSALSADVQAVWAKSGEHVNKNQVLVALDARDMQHRYDQRLAAVAQIKAEQNQLQIQYESNQAALEEEKAVLALQRKEVDRQKTLLNQRHGSQRDWDLAKQRVVQSRLAITQRQAALNVHVHQVANLQAHLRQANSQLKQAKLDLSRTQVHAPFEGRVVRVYTAQGDRVRAQQELIALFPVDEMEVRASIPTRYLRLFPKNASKKQSRMSKSGSLGWDVRLYATAYVDGERLLFRLDRLGSMIAEGEGSIQGYFRLISSHPPHLALGRLVKLFLSLPPQAQVARVPQSALYDGGRVYVVKHQKDGGDQLKGIAVTTVGTVSSLSKTATAYVLIRSENLREGARVVLTRLPQARTGLPVYVIN